MGSVVGALRQTLPLKHLIVPRLIAGLPLLLLGMKHFTDMEHFRAIMSASGLPAPPGGEYLAAGTEVLAGMLLLAGAFARIGGLLGIGTMLPALYSTVVLMNAPEPKPFVPPVPLPVAVLACSAYVLWRGGGAWSVDAASSKT